MALSDFYSQTVEVQRYTEPVNEISSATQTLQTVTGLEAVKCMITEKKKDSKLEDFGAIPNHTHFMMTNTSGIEDEDLLIWIDAASSIHTLQVKRVHPVYMRRRKVLYHYEIDLKELP